MEQILLRFWNEKLKVSMNDWKTVYLFDINTVQLIPEMYKGSLVDRIPQSSRHISYKTIKKGLKRKQQVIQFSYPF